MSVYRAPRIVLYPVYVRGIIVRWSGIVSKVGDFGALCAISGQNLHFIDVYRSYVEA